MLGATTIAAEAVFLYGWRPANDGRSSGREELHLFRCKSVPEEVHQSLRMAAGQYGFQPRRSSDDYVRKGSMESWAGWAHQKAGAKAEDKQQRRTAETDGRDRQQRH